MRVSFKNQPLKRFKLAIAQTAQKLVGARAQNGKIDNAVTINVERISPGHVNQGMRAMRCCIKAYFATGGRAIQHQLRRVGAACGIKLGQGIAIAVKTGKAATDIMFPTAIIDMVRQRLGRKHRGALWACRRAQHQPAIIPRSVQKETGG